MKKTTAFGMVLALVAGIGVHAVCFAESADASLVECTHVVDLSARLRCYDDHMVRLGHKIGVETPSAPKPTPTVAAVSPSPPPARTVAAPVISKPAEFGVSPELIRQQRAAAGSASPESRPELVARVRTVSERAHGELRIELDNDQVWVETQHLANTTPPAAGETVTLKHGTLGSYFLTRESGLALRVKRIR